MKYITDIAIKLKTILMNFFTIEIKFSEPLAKAAAISIVLTVVLSVSAICVFTGRKGRR